jgi:glutathione S-transferase
MKLRYSATSPYVRKVMMTAIEKGVRDRLELEPTNAWSPDTDLPGDNPLGKVPALVPDEGGALYDSPVICEYLDQLGSGPALFPPAGPARWTALRLQALGDGICDAAVSCRLEETRPEGERSAKWAARQRAAIARGTAALEAELDALRGPLTIGTLAALAALGYLDFRFAAEDWRARNPGLAAWFEEASARESYRATQPPEA